MNDIARNVAAEIDPAMDAARNTNLKIAQDNYRRANAKYQKIDATIEEGEKRLASRQNDLTGYKNVNADRATASAKLLLKGGDLKLPEKIAKNVAERDALVAEIQIVEEGLGALREQLKDAYANKRTCYFALDDAAAEILRADSDKLATRLATILEEARTIGQRLRAHQSSGVFPRTEQDVFVSARLCISGFGNQMLAMLASPLSLDRVGEGARTKHLVDYHVALIKDAAAELAKEVTV
jgi:hypothetical protein